MTLRAPAITTQQSTQHGRRKRRTGLTITNSKKMYICEISLFFFTVYTLWTPMFINSSILTVAEGGSNDIYDVVCS